MEIGNTQSVQSTSRAGAAAPQSSAKEVSSDFETFLRMLTVQMQNQDPLNPVESSDFAVQLATFSGVEQQVKTNDLLTRLTGEESLSGLTQLADWVGREARVPSHGYWDGAPITIYPSFQPDTNGAQLLVRDSSGAEVQRLDIPLSDEPIVWAGVQSDGSAFPQGSYRFDVISYDGEVPLGETPAAVYTTVTEVRVEDGQSVLVLEGGVTVPASQATALRS